MSRRKKFELELLSVQFIAITCLFAYQCIFQRRFRLLISNLKRSLFNDLMMDNVFYSINEFTQVGVACDRVVGFLFQFILVWLIRYPARHARLLNYSTISSSASLRANLSC